MLDVLLLIKEKDWSLFTMYSPFKEQKLIIKWNIEFWIKSKYDQLQSQI